MGREETEIRPIEWPDSVFSVFAKKSARLLGCHLPPQFIPSRSTRIQVVRHKPPVFQFYLRRICQITDGSLLGDKRKPSTSRRSVYKRLVRIIFGWSCRFGFRVDSLFFLTSTLSFLLCLSPFFHFSTAFFNRVLVL